MPRLFLCVAVLACVLGFAGGAQAGTVMAGQHGAAAGSAPMRLAGAEAMAEMVHHPAAVGEPGRGEAAVSTEIPSEPHPCPGHGGPGEHHADCVIKTGQPATATTVAAEDRQLAVTAGGTPGYLCPATVVAPDPRPPDRQILCVSRT